MACWVTPARAISRAVKHWSSLTASFNKSSADAAALAIRFLKLRFEVLEDASHTVRINTGYRTY
jgi:hypothetical protein